MVYCREEFTETMPGKYSFTLPVTVVDSSESVASTKTKQDEESRTDLDSGKLQRYQLSVTFLVVILCG